MTEAIDRASIEKVAIDLGTAMTADASEMLRMWLDQLVAWNAKLDLTAARGVPELLDLMLADALVLAQHIPKDVTMVDVGTGAGAPGLSLAVLRPDLRVTLVEPLIKRVAFLRTALAAIGRTDVCVLRMKAGDLRVRWDVAVARATFPPPAWLEEGADLVRDGGSVWVLLAKEAPPSQPGATLAEDITYTWPRTQVSRRAVRYVIDA